MNKNEADLLSQFNLNNPHSINQYELDFQSRNKITQRHLRTISHCERNNQMTLYQKKENDLKEKEKMINQKEFF